MGGAARYCLSNVSFEIPRSIFISSASRRVAGGRELKYSRKPVRERQAGERTHSTISIPKTSPAAPGWRTPPHDAQIAPPARNAEKNPLVGPFNLVSSGGRGTCS